MKTTLLILSSLFILNCVGQTKMISHKSHSGSSLHFKKALVSNLFNIGESNFGMAPERFVRNSKLDTVKLLSPQVAVMITSESCHTEDYRGNIQTNSSLWMAGTDTVFDHPIFNSKNSLTKIKTRLKNEYFFTNPIDSVVFIGFDGKYATASPTKDMERNSSSNNEVNKNQVKSKRPSIFMIIISFLISILFKTPFY